jgi:hypothetical protein
MRFTFERRRFHVKNETVVVKAVRTVNAFNMSGPVFVVNDFLRIGKITFLATTLD